MCSVCMYTSFLYSLPVPFKVFPRYLACLTLETYSELHVSLQHSVSSQGHWIFLFGFFFFSFLYHLSSIAPVLEQGPCIALMPMLLLSTCILLCAVHDTKTKIQTTRANYKPLPIAFVVIYRTLVYLTNTGLNGSREDLGRSLEARISACCVYTLIFTI